MEGCLDANQAVALVDDELDSDERADAEAHIAECPACRRLIAELARTEEVDQAGDDDALLMSIGRYEVRRVRGRGGMGAVYEAYDPKLDRQIALKLVAADADNVESASGSGSRGRLIREAHALAKLAHPNVVSVFDVGEADDDRIYIAMELIDGVTLGEWLSEPREVSAILEMFVAAGSGLVAAHEKGLVHRDFKPANVVVGEDGRPRVVDFGLVRAEQPDNGDAQTIPLSTALGDATRTGAIVGTPAYMAPEQLRGATLDARADQFAFAVALYEALYGNRPFSGKTVGELADSISRQEFADTASDSSIPLRVRNALRRALSADAEKRFSSLDELIDLLEPDSKSRAPTALAAVAAIAVAGVAVAWMVTSGQRSSPCDSGEGYFSAVWNDDIAAVAQRRITSVGHPAPAEVIDRVVAPMRAYGDAWQTLHLKACRATHVDKTQPEVRFERQLVCLFDRLERSRAIARKLTRATEPLHLDEAVAAIGRLPMIADCNNTTKLQAGLKLPSPQSQMRVAAIRARISQAATDLDMAGSENSLEIGRELVTDARATRYEPVIAEAIHLLGRISMYRGDNPGAEKLFREATTLAAQSNHDQLLASVWIDTISSLFEQAKYNEAIALGPVAEAAMERANSDARVRARGLQAIGESYWWLPEYGRALAMLQQAAQLVESTYGESDPDLPLSLALVAEALIDNEREDEALIVARRSAALAQTAFGARHSLTGWSQAVEGMALRSLGRYDEAKSVLTAARDLLLEITGGHPEMVWIHRELGYASFGLGDIKAALAHHQRAVDETAAGYGENDYRVSLQLRNIAIVQASLGKLDEAKASLERAIAIRISSRGSGHPTTAEGYLQLSDVEHRRGDVNAANNALDRAAAIYRADGGPADLAAVDAIRARILYADPAQRAAALALAERALPILKKADYENAARQLEAWLAASQRETRAVGARP